VATEVATGAVKPRAAEGRRAATPKAVLLPAISTSSSLQTPTSNDQFWVECAISSASRWRCPMQNAAFVLAALDNLSGSDALISLRGRISDRHFDGRTVAPRC
jgi:ABC-type uncharacterized transport system involved in gliding motility auxiliary subunit